MTAPILEVLSDYGALWGPCSSVPLSFRGFSLFLVLVSSVIKP